MVSTTLPFFVGFIFGASSGRGLPELLRASRRRDGQRFDAGLGHVRRQINDWPFDMVPQAFSCHSSVARNARYTN